MLHTKEEINKVKEICSKGDVPFYFVPSVDLKEAIVKNEHPYIVKLPEHYKTNFLEGNGFLVHQDMVIKFMENKLDGLNAFILANGEIRISNDINFLLKQKENKDDKK